MGKTTIKEKGGTSKNIDTAFKQAKAIYITQTIAQAIVFLASGVAIFLSTMWNYWGITVCAAFVCCLAVIRLLKF